MLCWVPRWECKSARAPRSECCAHSRGSRHEREHQRTPRANDNEAQSAGLARSRLAELGMPDAARSDIEAHVLATRSHRGENPDARLVLDLDLAVLGAPAHTFARFEQQIRAEYAHASETAFRAGRAAVLREFLARSEIYRTPALREQLEARARENLERRLLELSEFAAD